MSTLLDPLVVTVDATIRHAMQAIDRGTVEIALVTDSTGGLLGTVSDGDVRRALLAGAALDDPVAPYVARRPQVVGPESGRAEVLDLMRARSLAQIPVVGPEGRLLGLHVMRELLGATERPNTAVIMAGGRGRRLGSLTETLPKPMLPVAGRPILERLVLHLVGSGIRSVAISVNYRSEQIEDHFGDGSAFGCRIKYLREELDRPLGTGGSLALLDSAEHGDHPLLVMNGDLITEVAINALLESHVAVGAVATVAVRQYQHDVPFGVLEEKDGRLVRLVEKPTVTWPINAGIYVIEPRLLDRIPRGQEYAVTALFDDCLARGEHVHVWESRDDWQDIGRPDELSRARGFG